MDKIWEAVKEVKSNASLENYPEYCFYDNLYDAGLFKMEQVAAVEKILKVESSELRFPPTPPCKYTDSCPAPPYEIAWMLKRVIKELIQMIFPCTSNKIRCLQN